MKPSPVFRALIGALLFLGTAALLPADVPVPTADAGPGREIASILDTSTTVQSITAAPFAARGTTTKDVQARLEAATRMLSQLEARAAESSPAIRNAFAKAQAEVLARANALRDSLQKAAGTESEPAWDAVRSALSRDFGAYGQAATTAEATLQTPPNSSP